MGTGSVALWFLRRFWSADGACPLFRTVNGEHRGKRGQAPRGYCFPRNSGRYLLGASPHFPLPAYSLSWMMVAGSGEVRFLNKGEVLL